MILKQCIPTAHLQQIFSGASIQEDLYEAAAQEMLNETEIGIQLSAILDQESHLQKAKIRDMKASDLRQNLSIEFLEPGKTLGLILWALLSDERLSHRKLADELAERFSTSMDAPSPEASPGESSGKIAESKLLEEAPQDPSDALQENANLFVDQETPFDEETFIESVEINEELLHEVDDFIASLGEDSDSLEDLDAQSLLDDVDLNASSVESSGESRVMTAGEIQPGASSSDDSKAALPVPTVQLGGITISLSSLKRACESVFKEPVELVIDENLTQQDRIVIVGRDCGVRILHGPTWKQPVEPFRKSTGESVSINPYSLKLALSKIYGETVELIPDPQLLSSGRILFAGKTVGLEIMENAHITVPLPDWAEGEIPVNAKQAYDDSEPIVSAEERIAMLQMRLESLEQTLAAQSQDKKEFLDEDDFNTQTESNAKEILIEDSSESLGYDELDKPEEVHDQEISSLFFSSDAGEEDSFGEEDIDLSHLDLEDISQDAKEISQEDDEDSLREEAPAVEEITSKQSPEVNISPEDILETSESKDRPILELEEDEADANSDTEEEEDQFNLDDFDLESLHEDSLDEEEDSEEEDEADLDDEGESDEQLKDIDLSDILSELDSNEAPSSFVSEPVFHDEKILMLGGEEKHKNNYLSVIREIGGDCTWYPQLGGMPEGEIAELIDQADLIVTLSSDAITDPGILQAIQYAEENQKPVVQHHSSNPISVQKQLVKIMSDEE
ncbi:MAG: hypothetical protein ACP5I1_05555 [Candidatus Hinthialibacter sp.]